jgi:hypothetical protein
MVCPYLKRTVMPICRAKKGAFMAPNIHELQYYCMSVRYRECPIFKKNRSREGVKKDKQQTDKNAIK